MEVAVWILIIVLVTSLPQRVCSTDYDTSRHVYVCEYRLMDSYIDWPRDGADYANQCCYIGSDTCGTTCTVDYVRGSGEYYDMSKPR